MDLVEFIDDENKTDAKVFSDRVVDMDESDARIAHDVLLDKLMVEENEAILKVNEFERDLDEEID